MEISPEERKALNECALAEDDAVINFVIAHIENHINLMRIIDYPNSVLKTFEDFLVFYKKLHARKVKAEVEERIKD